MKGSRSGYWRWPVRLVAVASGALIGISLAGGLHPAGDSFAVFRTPLVAVFALAVLLSGWRRALRAGLLLLTALAMVPVLGPRLADRLTVRTAPSDLVLYQQNLLYSRNESAAWLARIAETAPDVITLQEVSRRNLALLKALRAKYPTQHVCPVGAVGGVAILSRYTAIAGSRTCAPRDGLAAIRLATAQGPVWAVSIHLHWPWPHQQAAHARRLEPWLDALEGPVVIGGDFNSVAWSHAVARLARASGTRVAGPFRATFRRFGYPLGIDHVLAPPGFVVRTEVQPRLGSDHHGVLARITR